MRRVREAERAVTRLDASDALTQQWKAIIQVEQDWLRMVWHCG